MRGGGGVGRGEGRESKVQFVQKTTLHCALILILLSNKSDHQCWNFRTIYGARNMVGIGLSYRLARLHRQAESVSWNRFLGFLKVLKYRLRGHVVPKTTLHAVLKLVLLLRGKI